MEDLFKVMGATTRLGLTFLLFFNGSNALSKTTPLTPSIATGCPATISELQFSARFDLGKKMEIRIGKFQNSNPLIKKTGALITAQQPNGRITCEAVCSLNWAEPEVTLPGAEAIRPSSPASLAFSCQSVGFKELSVPVTLLRKSYISAIPILRFGTWLDGYRDAALHVTVDTYSRPERHIADATP